MQDDHDHVVSSSNVFADLGVPEPEEALTKAELVRQISVLIQRAKLTQVQASEVLALDQPKVSALLHGRIQGFSMERLLRFLTLLGQDVEIRIVPKTSANRPAEMRVSSNVARHAVALGHSSARR